MEDFHQRLMVRAATFDEVLSDAFVTLPGQKGDSDQAARRLAAWCRACASGDWVLFARRLERDGWAIADVLSRFATIAPHPDRPTPTWVTDASWIDAVLNSASESADSPVTPDSCPFDQLLVPVVQAADARLSAAPGVSEADLGDDARASLRRALLVQLADLAAPALYERFDELRQADGGPGAAGVYDRFVAESRAGGWRRLFEDKPVLLRLMSSLTRQWIEASRELIVRLHADLADLRREFGASGEPAAVASVELGRSDPHNFGRSVGIVGFADGSHVVYKPKDLRVDAAWVRLVDGLNGAAPIALRAAKVLERDGYGWTEFVEHSACVDDADVAHYFRRAGAWLALLHGFVSVDMHQENVIASGAHPVPIDLEMILQAADDRRTAAGDDAGAAHAAAMKVVIDSVLTVGLLPAYGRYSTSKVFAIGGVTSNTAPRTTLGWKAINSDAMRPRRVPEPTRITNLPHLAGRHSRLSEHVRQFAEGFQEYAAYLGEHGGHLVDDFAGLPTRTVLRPTRFYYMLLHRMRNHHAMDDGVTWSVQADFGARLADWERDDDPTWPLQRAERAALVDLNVPHFVVASDGQDVHDLTGRSMRVFGATGLERARARLAGLDAAEIAWQLDVITQNTGTLRRPTKAARALTLPAVSGREPGPTFLAEADAVARTLAEHAIRRGKGAAWIGLDWVGDSEVSQLVVLGPELYNGSCGIAVFLAAHATCSGSAAAETSGALALAAVAAVRAALRGRHPARLARSLGVGGALGMGSIVYGLAVIADLLDDDTVLADANLAADLITDELIAADRQLDLLGGSAGAILGLLRLYRQTGAPAALARAVTCGRHLLAAERVGPMGGRSWAATAFGRPINGMSHGAAGYAYALAMLASATDDEEFARAAHECVAFENTTFDPARENWSDMRGGATEAWPSKWCYGAPGIGLARAATVKHAARHAEGFLEDVRRAVAGAGRGWPVATDTLCCGTLATVELHHEASVALDRAELGALAEQQMLAVIQAARSAADYRWSNGASRFNLSLFRGIAGVGYTALRRVHTSLPNLLTWE